MRRLAIVLVLLAIAAPALAQSITEFPIPSEADSWDICIGPDGALWFNEPEAQKIGRIDLQGEITEFPITFGAYGVAAGPDDHIWFTAGTQGIGKMTTAGEITMYPPLEPEETVAFPVIAGSDGNMWVGLLEGRIARITPAGAVTYFTLGFPTPIPGIGGPYSLALGSDNNVWYSLPTLNVVGKITPDGVVTNYPTPGVSAYAIGLGPDGALWFVGDTGIIDRITTQGDLQTIGQADGGISPAIAPGPDGNVWLAEDGNETLGRLTLGGAFSHYELPQPEVVASSGAWDILTGPDGNLWYVRRGENRIGRVTLPGQRQPVERPRERGHPPIVIPRS